MKLTKEKFIQWIDLKSKDRDPKDQEINNNLRIFGSVLIVLSGLLLYSDKLDLSVYFFDRIFNAESNNYYGFQDSKTFVWMLCQSLSPLLVAFSSFLKPYRFSYSVPVYFYTIQVYWIFRPSIQFDDYLLQAYAVGTTITFLSFVYLIKRVKLFYDKQAIENTKFREQSLKEIRTLRELIISK